MSASTYKSYVIALVKILAKFAFTVIAFYLAFSFLFHFGDGQALGLGLAFAVALDLASSRKPAKQASFTPHRLSLQFHVYPMLMDLGLIKGDEQWAILVGDPPSPRVWAENSVYHYSISAFVIGTDPGLVHYPALQTYSEHWKLDVKLDGLQLPGSYWAWSPDVFIKPWGGGDVRGCHIGVRVNESWWELNKSAVAAGVVLHEDKEWNFGTVRLTLAVLPHEITHAYYREVDRSHQVSVKELVGKSGWTNTDLGGAEIGYFGESYEHKYARVLAQHLDL